jgi:hypothetical protein
MATAASRQESCVSFHYFFIVSRKSIVCGYPGSVTLIWHGESAQVGLITVRTSQFAPGAILLAEESRVREVLPSF